MKKNKISVWWATCLLAVVSVVALTTPGPVSAAAFRATWDPLYGAPFTDLGWRGTADFEIPASPPCHIDGTACIAGSFLKSANVIFYRNSTGDDFADINWTQSSLAGVAINGLAFGSGAAPTQLDTDLFPGLNPSLLTGVSDPSLLAMFSAVESYTFGLQFVISQSVPGTNYSGPRLYWSLCGECRGDDCGTEHHKKRKRHFGKGHGGDRHADRVRHRDSGDDHDDDDDDDDDRNECRSGGNDVNIPINFSITQVPEPGSGALVGLALVAAGVTLRRTRRQAARSL
jgi:hypothetical protein